LPDGIRYLLDVNVLIALTTTAHVHHSLVKEWFHSDPHLLWAICAFTEAGFLRTVTAPRNGQVTMHEAAMVLAQLQTHPGYRYQPVDTDWQTLTRPFQRRLFGHNQVTDAYLLGLALKEDMVLVTLDRALLHLAGERKDHVLLLKEVS
jgi:toxin-antitoxin system PIN domain toxin